MLSTLLINHRYDLSSSELVYLFIEEREDRYNHLQSVIQRVEIPSHVKIQTICGTFAEHMAEVIDSLGDKFLAPAFVMIDPFGVRGIPFDLIKRLASYQKSEFLISFMYEPIARWLAQPEFAPHLDALFGRFDWRDAVGMPAVEKRRFLLDLYLGQLRAAGMRYARSFTMLNEGGRTEYFLIFATRHIEGLRAIKHAMWTVNPSGSFQFSDQTNPEQLTLFQDQPDFAQLKNLIVRKFDRSIASIDQIEFFVLTETAFRETHVRQPVLVPMEKEKKIRIVATRRKRRFTYPAGTKIEFLSGAG